MRCGDADAIFVRDPLIFWIVKEENGARIWVSGPHGWPHEICFESQEQLEHLDVEFRVVPSKLFQHPTCKGWGFVIDEDTSVLNARLAVDGLYRQGKYIGMMFRRDVGPPIPTETLANEATRGLKKD